MDGAKELNWSDDKNLIRVFFSQAEDGIRVRNVTGVQTCALPIYPRATATLQAIRDELNKDGHIYRFQHGGKPLGEAEGSFTACGIMMVLAMAKHDELMPALDFYERARMASTGSGLFTEEFDVASHQLPGNLPQAFVHALFIEAAMQLAPIVDCTSDQENI